MVIPLTISFVIAVNAKRKSFVQTQRFRFARMFSRFDKEVEELFMYAMHTHKVAKMVRPIGISV